MPSAELSASLLCGAFECMWSSNSMRGRPNENTLWPKHCRRDHFSQMSTRFAMRATFVCDTNFVSSTHILKYSETFLGSIRAACNKVAAFCHGRAPSQDTMLPSWWVLVLPGPKALTNQILKLNMDTSYFVDGVWRWLIAWLGRIL